MIASPLNSSVVQGANKGQQDEGRHGDRLKAKKYKVDVYGSLSVAFERK